MVLSQTATYALRAILCLAEAEGSGPLRVDDIAEELDVPRNYLSKILHVLARADVLQSTRGPGGGFELAKALHELRLSEIVGHFDDLPEASACLLGKDRCSDEDPCAAHDQWKNVSGSIRAFFDETTLKSLLKDSHTQLQRSTEDVK